MNIADQWKKIEGIDDDLTSLIKTNKIIKWSSKDPLQKIKKNLLLNSLLGFLIIIGYLVIMIKFPFWPILICIGITLIFTGWASLRAFRLFRDIQYSYAQNSVLKEMEKHYFLLKKWLGLQQEVGLLIYPVSAAGGFMLGGFLGSGKPIEELMQKPVMIIGLIISILILVPICFYFAKWMSKKAFGQYADQLKQNIDSLKSA